MIVLFSDDLLDASKTIASGRAAGATVLQCKTLQSVEAQLETQTVTCCIIDLQYAAAQLGEIVSAASKREKKPTLIAYGSHVDAAGLKAARDAGCDLVMPRSKYFEEMPGLIATWGRPVLSPD